MKKEKIILDTDIGTDIDDALALVLALNSPEIDLEAITTVYGDTELRSRLTQKILRLSQREEIPVGKGNPCLLTEGKEAHMDGWEGKGFLEAAEFETSSFPEAADLIISKVKENPGEVTIITIGPLTNAAQAIKKKPEIVQDIKQLIAMGGVIYPPKLGWSWSAEHNFNCDPEASRIVFESGMPITMVGLDVTLEVWLVEADIDNLRKINTPLVKGVLSMLDIWLKKIDNTRTCLHDPLAVSVAIDRSLVKTKRMPISLEMKEGVLRTIPDKNKGQKVDVCIDVESSRFHKFFMERITS